VLNTQLYILLSILVVVAVGGHVAVAMWLWRLSRADDAPLEAVEAVEAVDAADLDLRGWFTEAEGAWYRAAAAVASGTLVEVGCWRGRSTSFLAPVLRGQPARLLCVDHWAGSSDGWNAAYQTSLAESAARGEPVQACFERNMAALKLPHTLLAMPSAEAALQVPDGSCGLVFLDGSHDEAAVAADLEVWWPKIAPGGLLAGHDYEPTKHPGLVAAVQAFAGRRAVPVERGPGRIYVLAAAASASTSLQPER